MSLQERNAYLTKKRWLALFASCIANLCIGGVYAWSVFAGPMAAYFNEVNGTALSAADLAYVFSFTTGVEFITSIAGGYMGKKIGADKVIRIGVGVFGLGFIVCSLATSPALLTLGFGVMCGLSGGFAYVCTISNSVKFFPDKKGLVGGISTASYGISSVLIPPIANMLIRSVGVGKAFFLFGLVILVLGLGSSLFILHCPDDFSPVGYAPSGKGEGFAGTRDYSAWEMLRTPVFACMLFMLCIGASLGLMILSSAADIAEGMVGMGSGAAAAIVSALALFGTAGRLLCGWLSDKIGRIGTLTGSFVASIAALFFMYVSGGMKSAPLFSAGICLLGLCYGAFMSVYPGFTSDQFGTANSSLNYGIMFVGFSLGGLVGPLLMQRVYERSGSYRPAFLVAMALGAVGLLLTFLYRVLRDREAANTN